MKDLEMIVKQAQENMNIKEQMQWYSLDYLKSSAYFVECAKREIGHVTFALGIELTYTLLDKLVEMFFQKVY
jgi:hypothetical protein